MMGCGSSRRVQVMPPVYTGSAIGSEVECSPIGSGRAATGSEGWVSTATLPMHFEVLVALPASLDQRTGNIRQRYMIGEVQGVCPSSGELLVATKAGLTIRVARSEATMVSVTKRAYQLPPALENRVKDM